MSTLMPERSGLGEPQARLHSVALQSVLNKKAISFVRLVVALLRSLASMVALYMEQLPLRALLKFVMLILKVA